MSQIYYDAEGNEISLYKLVRQEPDWAMSRVQVSREQAEEIEKLKQRIAELEQALQWQPIETVQRDQGEILVAYAKQGFVKQLVRYNHIKKYWESKGEPQFGLENNATHWMSLSKLSEACKALEGKP